jgi:hypothetical protein
LRIDLWQAIRRQRGLKCLSLTEAAELPERHNYPDIEESEEDDSGEISETMGEPETKKSMKISFKNFLTRLVKSAKFYSEVVSASTSDVRINRHLQNLRMIKAAQTYGFLMHLRAGGCSDKDFREILTLTAARDQQ